ncbi:MAG: M48 family metalloprotease [Candidatus Omnitrophica bacterium]|nr:M48 family metalloprotease [Candidatus Omnitrophota bacterium]
MKGDFRGMHHKYRFFYLCGLLVFLNSGCAQQYYNVATQQEETYFYSVDKEVRIGEVLSVQVERTYPVDNDALIQQRVDQIGQRLAAAGDRREIRYYFKVVDEKEVNAFALPGGYVYMFKGLWDKVKDSDDRIAAVLAHEIAHISARHSIKRLQSALGYNVLTVLVATSRSMNSAAKAQAMAGINELILSYSREDELQSDVLAVRYLSKSGFDPAAVLDVLKMLQQMERDRPIKAMSVQTHPYLTERMKTVKEILNRGSIGFNDYINTSSY